MYWKFDTGDYLSYLTCECCCYAVNFSRVSQFKRDVNLEIKLVLNTQKACQVQS